MKNKISLSCVLSMIFLLVLPPSYGFTQDKPIIGVAGISHESNSFSSQKTNLEDFNVKLGQTAEERADLFFALANERTTSSGYIEGAKKFGMDLYPALLVRARPMGPVTDAAFETMMREMIQQLKSGPKLDGVLLNLHGAMVVESFPSGDEEIVKRVREAFGPELPIIVTHDFHANITPKIIEYSDVLITFKENPHLDTYDRGLQAAEIMAKMVRGEINPVQSLVKPSMVYNIVFQNTFSNPFLPITAESKKVEENAKVLAVSVAGGYQYAD